MEIKTVLVVSRFEMTDIIRVGFEVAGISAAVLQVNDRCALSILKSNKVNKVKLLISGIDLLNSSTVFDVYPEEQELHAQKHVVSGFDFVRLARLTDPSVKILIMSGNPDYAREAGKLGCSFIGKPFTLREFAAKIKDVMGIE